MLCYIETSLECYDPTMANVAASRNGLPTGAFQGHHSAYDMVTSISDEVRAGGGTCTLEHRLT